MTTAKTTRADKPVRPLANCSRGERVQLMVIHGGQELKSRLTAMGLSPGVRLAILRGDEDGPFIVALKGMRFILGRGVAQKLGVQ